MKNFEKFCSECLDVTICSTEKKEKTFKIRGENIVINAEFVRCHSCNKYIADLERDENNYQQAFDVYRKRKNLLIPSKITAIRNKYGMSQRVFAKLLGWSHATLSRYESGGLQSISHNNELILLSKLENMSDLLEMNKANLTDKEYLRVRNNLNALINSTRSQRLYTLLSDYYCNSPVDIFSGFRRCSIDKATEMIKFFSFKDSKVLKVKLMKYLWYADFLHFKRYTISISGLRYVRAQFGPVPEEHELLLNLANRGGVTEEPCVFPNYIGTGYLAESFNDTLFTSEEIEAMSDVLSHFRDFNSSSISEYSHKEKAYLDTDAFDYISYENAEELSITIKGE